jgi:hypothetical protein
MTFKEAFAEKQVLSAAFQDLFQTKAPIETKLNNLSGRSYFGLVPPLS